MSVLVARKLSVPRFHIVHSREQDIDTIWICCSAFLKRGFSRVLGMVKGFSLLIVFTGKPFVIGYLRIFSMLKSSTSNLLYPRMHLFIENYFSLQILCPSLQGPRRTFNDVVGTPAFALDRLSVVHEEPETHCSTTTSMCIRIKRRGKTGSWRVK